MPKQITTTEQFEELLPKASECRIVRTADQVKLKLRTPSYLYTFVTTEDTADDLIKRLKDIEIIDYTPQRKEKSKEPQKQATSEQEDEKEDNTAAKKKRSRVSKKERKESSTDSNGHEEESSED